MSTRNVVAALTEAASYIGSRTCVTPDCPHCADAALLRELAQRITEYREAYAKWNATARAFVNGSAPVSYVAVYDDTESALLALVRGEATPTPEDRTT
jgi:hypothetical protein